MLLKVSSFHVYTHQDTLSDTIENCTVCDVALKNQTLELLTIALFVIGYTTFLILDKKVSLAKNPKIPSSFFRFKFFGRPPPIR